MPNNSPAAEAAHVSITYPTPHGDKIRAALANPKCVDDVDLLREIDGAYRAWVTEMTALTTNGRQRVNDMTALLNAYKDKLEVDFIMARGSAFLKRQKGQLKLDNSVLEEFLAHLVHPDIISGLGHTQLAIGPQNAFMSLSFHPHSFSELNNAPETIIKTKDQDFVLGSEVHYKFSPTSSFEPAKTTQGSFVLAVLAAECKVNLDKTMFQEASGTAARLKQGCPMAQYFLLVEYLDMTPEDSRLTAIDNVFLSRHAKRLPSDRRDNLAEVRRQHTENPIDASVVWLFVEQIQSFVGTVWYDPDEAIRRGTFV